MKRVLSLFLVLILLLVPCFSAQTSAFVGTVTAGTGLVYAVLASVLLASGVAVFANSDSEYQVNLEAIYNAMPTHVKTALQTSTMLLDVNGQLISRWASSQWNTLTNWIQSSFFADGTTVFSLPSTYPSSLPIFTLETVPIVTSFSFPFLNGDRNLVSETTFQTSYLGSIFQADFRWNGNQYSSTSYKNFKFILSDSVISCGPSAYSGSYYIPSSVFDITLPYVTSLSDTLKFTFKLRTNSRSVSLGINSININYNGNVLSTNVINTIAGSLGISVSDWIYKSILAGHLVGDLTSLGGDVVVPGNPFADPIGCDVLGDKLVGEGSQALPDTVADDITVDIPLTDCDVDTDADDTTISCEDWPDVYYPLNPSDVLGRINDKTDIRDNTPVRYPDDVLPTDLAPGSRVYPDVDTYPTIRVPVTNPDGTLVTYPDGKPVTQDIPIEEITNVEGEIIGTTLLDPDNIPDKASRTANKLKFPSLALTKFPFCIPWDIYNSIKVLRAPAAAPKFTIPIVVDSVGINESVTVDFSDYQTYCNVVRWFLCAAWVFCLILLTRRVVWK